MNPSRWSGLLGLCGAVCAASCGALDDGGTPASGARNGGASAGEGGGSPSTTGSGGTTAASGGIEAGELRGSSDAAASMLGLVDTGAMDRTVDGDLAKPFDDGYAPTSLAGLVLWLDAESGVTETEGKVSRWSDRSALHNDAVQTNTQYRPTLLNQALNGHAVVEFKGPPADVRAQPTSSTNGTKLQIADSPSINFGTDDVTLLFVSEHSNQPPPGIHLHGRSDYFARDLDGGVKLWLSANWPGSTGSIKLPTAAEGGDGTDMQMNLGETYQGAVSKTHNLNDGKFRVYVGQRVGTSLRLAINGAAPGVSDLSKSPNPIPSLSSSNKAPAYIGANASSFAIDAKIAEVVIVRGKLDDADLGKLVSHYMNKYTIAP